MKEYVATRQAGAPQACDGEESHPPLIARRASLSSSREPALTPTVGRARRGREKLLPGSPLASQGVRSLRRRFCEIRSCGLIALSSRGGKVKLNALARRAFESVRRSPPWDNQEPIREELFSVERLEEHARSLALAQIVSSRTTKGQPLARRLADNGAVLLEAYRAIVKAINEGRAITPAAEWLIDNYHLVEKQIRELRSDLPPGYYRQLPKLASGPFAGYPRVFGVTWAFVAHTDSRFDSEMLVRYVRAYQEVQPLTIGELWAVSITLRIVLVENLGRLAQQITQSRAARYVADGLADRLLGTGGRPAESVAVVLFAHERAPLSEALAVQLVHRLRDQDPRITPALTWLDQRLAIQDTTAETVVRDVHRRQGAVERHRAQHHHQLAPDFRRRLAAIVRAAQPRRRRLRRRQPVRGRWIFRRARSTAARSRNWRAARSARSWISPAPRCSRRVASGTRTPTAEQARRGDPGYHLLAGGRRAFEAALSYRPPMRNWLARLNRSLGVGGYVTAISLVAAILLAAPLLVLAAAGISLAVLGLLGVLGAIPAIDAAVALVNRGVNLGFAATLLPALELRDGVPSHLRTLVAVPTLLTTLEAVEEQIERLEIHHLASPEGDLHFALVSDWTDSATEHAEGDAALVAAAAEGVARLNRRYGPAPGGAALSASASPSRLERRRSRGGSAGSASAASCTN